MNEINLAQNGNTLRDLRRMVTEFWVLRNVESFFAG